MLHSRSRIALALLLGAVCMAGCGRETGLGIAQERVKADEADIEAEMIELIREISLKRREEANDDLVRRFNQPKTIACVEGRMTVAELEPRLAVGLFARPASYPVTLRFANATKFDDREKDLRGLSIRVSGVADAKSVDGGSGVQDFLLNSHPVLFAGTPEDFLAFIRATASDRVISYFLNPLDPHLKSLWIVLQARGTTSSPLAVQYFSTTPFAHGEGAAVKYAVRSCAPGGPGIERDDADYLRRALDHDLSSGNQCLDFMVQFQSDPDLMPVEDASVDWPEDVSPFRAVARIVLEAQDIASPEALARCEAMRFNPWNGLAAHRPLGGINRVRKNVYEALGRFRSAQNADVR